MSQMYTVQFNAVAATAQQDFFELTNAATSVLFIHSVELSQSSDYGDAQDEGLSILMKRGVSTTSGSGGSAPTPAKLETGTTAATATAEVNNTTKQTGGTITTLRADVWSVRAPYLYLPTPEMRIVLAPSERFTVELATTPADSLTCNGTLTYERIG